MKRIQHRKTSARQVLPVAFGPEAYFPLEILPRPILTTLMSGYRKLAPTERGSFRDYCEGQNQAK